MQKISGWSIMFKKIFGLKTIQTARTLEEINVAAKEGYWPLIKVLQPCYKIKTKRVVFQDKNTGEIATTQAQSRDLGEGFEDFEYVMTVWYYPYKFESPFAAYLIPKNLKKGEKVFLTDLIEDYVGWYDTWGNAARLDECEAIWNGSDFDILYDEKKDYQHRIG